MKKHAFEAPGWTNNEEASLAVFTGDLNWLEQIDYIVREETPILMSEKAWKTQTALSLTSDLHTFIVQISLLESRR